MSSSGEDLQEIAGLKETLPSVLLRELLRETGIRTMRFDSTPRRSARRSSSNFSVHRGVSEARLLPLRPPSRLSAWGEVNGLTADDELPGVRSSTHSPNRTNISLPEEIQDKSNVFLTTSRKSRRYDYPARGEPGGKEEVPP